MKKSILIYSGIFLLALLLVIVGESRKEEPIDWRSSYEADEKIPLGGRILFEQLESLFPHQSLEENDRSIYQTLTEYTPDSGSVFFFLTDNFSPDRVGSEKLMEFIRSGGHVFVAASNISGPLSDSLGIETTYSSNAFVIEESQRVILNFTSPSLRRTTPYTFSIRNGVTELQLIDYEEEWRVLELQEEEEEYVESGVDEEIGRGDLHAMTMQRKIGEGSVILTTMPTLFSNYGLLQSDGFDHAARLFSYLPSGPIIWDEHYKPVDESLQASGRGEAAPPFQYILSRPPLRIAFHALLITALLFIIFSARRRQRIIPVIRPPQNTTLEFVHTVSSLYDNQTGFARLAEKRTAYLLDYIRTHLGLPTQEITSDFITRVSERSGVAQPQVERLFRLVGTFGNASAITAGELVQLSDEIEAFYASSER